MGQIAISITKRVPFRDATQEFSNTYHYGSTNINPSESQALDLIDEVVAAEKTFHSTLVSFVLGRCWSSGGTIATNVMIAEKTLTGTGSSATGTAIDPERAVLIQWDAGKDSKGRPVRLKKWYHCYGAFGSTVMSNAHLSQQTGFTAAQRTAMAALADSLTRIGLELWGLKAESGRERDLGIGPTAHKFFEHHQLGDQWR